MRFANRPRLWDVGIAGGDRLPVLFLKGAARGFMLALMPLVREWLESYGGAGMDGDTFDRCEADWHALIEWRKRQIGAYLAGLAAGTVVYALGVLALLAFLGWVIWTLVPVAPVPSAAVAIALMMGIVILLHL